MNPPASNGAEAGASATTPIVMVGGMQDADGGAGGEGTPAARDAGIGSGGASSEPGAGGSSAGGSASTAGSGGAASDGPITVWIAGDSTVANGQTPCPRGWGGVLDARFDERVTVVNSAVGGRSVHTWLHNVQDQMDASGECVLARDASGNPTLQPRWQAMLDGMQPGDFLFIQFGINDGDPTCDRHVGIEAFRAAYAMMAEAARARGTQPIFVTPVSMIACSGATPRGSRGAFVPATIEEGARLGVPVIDLHERSVERYTELAFCPVAGGDVSAATTGPVGDFFCDDHTHFAASGAEQIATLIVEGLRDGAIPLATYLR